MTETNSINVAKDNNMIIKDSETQAYKNNDDLRIQDANYILNNKTPSSDVGPGEGGNYWKLRYDKLLNDYNNLLQKNQNLEEKLLNVVECFEKKKEELILNIEHEKTTLMADVNKLSTKLVDARIKLHDYEEKELIHASECSAPCHKNCSQQLPNHSSNSTPIGANRMFAGTKQDNTFDPNLV